MTQGIGNLEGSDILVSGHLAKTQSNMHGNSKQSISPMTQEDKQ